MLGDQHAGGRQTEIVCSKSLWREEEKDLRKLKELNHNPAKFQGCDSELKSGFR